MTSAPDPDVWPLAPGNASPEMEADFAAQAARWPEPTAELRERVSRLLNPHTTHSDRRTA